MDRADPRLRKRPLLFLVGEVRRDVIPRTLQGAEGVVSGGPLGDVPRRIDVHEWEVYSTGVMESSEDEFRRLTRGFEEHPSDVRVVVVVVFSPQGCEAMLRSLGLLDHRDGGPREGETERRRRRTRYVIATIGPTTRDHLVETFGVEPDVCAAKPSPEGVGEGVIDFLRRNGLLDQ